MTVLTELLSNRRFSLTILPTEKCNFRCTYCYENFEASKMSDEIIQGIKRLILRRVSDLEYLNIDWFGGEPLVAKDVVLNISKFVKKLSKRHPQLEYRSGMTTNGYLLTPDLFSELTNLNVLDYQITLDGPSDIHNKTRLKANGGGTFDKIWENLLEIKKSSAPVSILIRVHATPDNIMLLDPLIEDLRQEFISDPRFKVLFRAVGHAGGPNDKTFDVFPTNQRGQIIKSLEKKLYGENYTFYEEKNPYICYASRPNHMVIRSDGKINKCTVALYDNHNHIGSLLPDGTVKINQDRLSPWLRGIENLDYSILQCPLKGISGI
ncbi:radical SAM protein [Bacillus sp. H1a]|uniref:radical SAM protein n=1 Tax=Bacillus sp. H1a TaxID=1397276 RepID=UPI00046816C4|nr:radical SAM protein [Bacillus sp. H1a]